MHYLEKELYGLFGTGGKLFDFLRAGSLDGVWYWDLENPEHEWISPEFWEHLGYDPAEMPHTTDSWQEIIHPADLQVCLQNFNRHLEDADHPYDQNVRYQRAQGGEYVTVRCRGMAIRNDAGDPIRMLGAHTDLTDLVNTETALRAAVDDLTKARKTAEAALRAKTVFLETMSHEIRTPMNGILGMAQALQGADLEPREARMVEVITHSATSLLTLLNDILDMSRIEAGKISMELADFSPATVIADAAALFMPIAQEKNLDLIVLNSVELTSDFVGSARAVRQVVSNLISNAVKFSAQGAVEVRATMEPEGRDKSRVLKVAVVDRGPGVPAMDKEEIFQRFSQGHEMGCEKHRGAGLGLAIARQLCELHGGSLDVADTPGGGATFEAQFLLQPASWDRPKTAQPVTSDHVRSDALRLLVAEDNEMNRMVLAAMLETMNVELTFATNGAEAFDLAWEGKFDAGFIDIRMPMVSGVDFVRRLRTREQEKGSPRLPLVACSANVLTHQIESYSEAGFDRHLAKPITLDELRSTVNWVWSTRLAVNAA